jgi:hypothetical protein
MREIYSGHSARAEFALETVAVSECGDETFGCVGQWTPKPEGQIETLDAG